MTFWQRFDKLFSEFDQLLREIPRAAAADTGVTPRGDVEEKEVYTTEVRPDGTRTTTRTITRVTRTVRKEPG